MNDALRAAQALLASRAKYQEAHVAAQLAEIQALLAAPFEDPHDTTVEITAGTPVEQPPAPPVA